MRIESYDITLSSERTYEQRDHSVEQIRQWGPRKEIEDNDNSERSGRRFKNDQVSISARAKRAFGAQVEQSKVSLENVVGEYEPEEELKVNSRLMVLKRMIEFFTGREINLSNVFRDKERAEGQDGAPPDAPVPIEGDAPSEEIEQGWGMSYSSYQSHYEHEQTSFSASGLVKTADGKEIQFSLDLEMSREFFTEERFEMTAGDPLIDPLIINYSGKAAELSDMKFEFDLNADGQNEQISYLNPGSGFLVFDKNEDGIINDGSEMFGPITGDGFNELAAYDEDNNNWIDENDSIYDKLALWHKSNDVDMLSNLRDSNVGAIYLGNVDSQFDLKNSANELYGRVQKTGMYLSEDGNAGTVQQIDLSA